MFLIVTASPSWAAEIPHVFAEQNTQQTTTNTTYTDITGLSIADGSLVDGATYLLVFSGTFSEDGASLGWWQAMHGSTAFAESEHSYARSSTNVDHTSQTWFTVWTAAVGEGVKMQFKHNSGTQTVTMNYGSILAIRLDGYLTANVDYCFNERGTDDSLSTTPSDGGSCTITPSGASDWLVLSYSQIDTTDTTTRNISRIVRSGEAASTLPQSNHLPEITSGTWGHFHARVFALTGVANTFKEQTEASATANTRLHSSLLMMNLNKFAAHTGTEGYTEAALSLTTTSYVEIESVSITPTVTGDVWIGAAFILDKTASSSDVEFIIQVDNSDQPAGQTASDLDNDSFNTTDTSNDISISRMTMTSLSNAAHTADLDANRNTNSDVKQRMIWAVTMELAAGAATQAHGAPILFQ